MDVAFPLSRPAQKGGCLLTIKSHASAHVDHDDTVVLQPGDEAVLHRVEVRILPARAADVLRRENRVPEEPGQLRVALDVLERVQLGLERQLHRAVQLVARLTVAAVGEELGQDGESWLGGGGTVPDCQQETRHRDAPSLCRATN